MAAFKGVEGRKGRYVSPRVPAKSDFEVPDNLPSTVERPSSRLPAVDVDGGFDGGVDAASRGLGLRYKANIFPE